MIKLIRYHLPPFVKHVLAPRMIFVWQITTVAGWTLTRSTKYKIKTFTKEPPSDWFQDELCLDGGDDWSRGRPARVGGDGQGGPHQPLHQVRKSQTSLILPFQCAQVQVRVPQGCGAKEQMAGSTSWGYYRHNFFLIKIFVFISYQNLCLQETCFLLFSSTKCQRLWISVWSNPCSPSLLFPFNSHNSRTI